MDERPRVLFLLAVGTGSPLAAGSESAAAGIIELAGGRNAMRGFHGYKPASPEAIVAAEPEVVLVTDSTVERMGGRESLLARPVLASTPAGASGRVVVMDGLLLTGFGARTPEAVRTLAGELHPAMVNRR